MYKRQDLCSGDFYGPLPTSVGGIKYIFVIIDNFIKYVKLYTLRRATTTGTLKRVRQYYEEFGSPKALLRDNGTQFTARQWVSGLERLNIQPRYTAIRNPCSNLAERVNRQLGNLFRIFINNQQHTKWSRYVKTIENCLNESYHETIEITPYEAHLGKKPIRIWEKYIDADITKDNQENKTEIFVKIRTKREKHAKRINESNKTTKFEIGDLVLIRTYTQSDATQKHIEKFCELFSGPFKICLLYTSRCV